PPDLVLEPAGGDVVLRPAPPGELGRPLDRERAAQLAPAVLPPAHARGPAERPARVGGGALDPGRALARPLPRRRAARDRLGAALRSARARALRRRRRPVPLAGAARARAREPGPDPRSVPDREPAARALPRAGSRARRSLRDRPGMPLRHS